MWNVKTELSTQLIDQLVHYFLHVVQCGPSPKQQRKEKLVGFCGMYYATEN